MLGVCVLVQTCTCTKGYVRMAIKLISSLLHVRCLLIQYTHTLYTIHTYIIYHTHIHYIHIHTAVKLINSLSRVRCKLIQYTHTLYTYTYTYTCHYSGGYGNTPNGGPVLEGSSTHSTYIYIYILIHYSGSY